MALSRVTAAVSTRARTVVVAIGKKVPPLLTATRWVVTAFRRIGYRSLWSRRAVRPSTAVFETFNGRGYSDSPRALYQAMLRDHAYDGFEKIWAFRSEIAQALSDRGGYEVRGLAGAAPANGSYGDLDTLLSPEALEELRGAVIVPWSSREYRRSYARAGLWVSNSILPPFMEPRPGQTYLQTWHGTPLKRLGCDIRPEASGNAMFAVRDIHARYRREGARFTWLLSPSRYASERFASAFDLVSTGREGVIVEDGYPRNDFLATHGPSDVEAIRARIGIPVGKKVVLYAPTFRDDRHASRLGYTYEVEADFDALRAALGEDHVVLFRAHYLVASAFDFAAQGGFVIDVSKTGDINDLYVISDVLVTDYSSVFFDYANLRRPVVFYMYDLEHYAHELRGFYLDIDELPGPIVRTTAELVDAIKTAGESSDADKERYERFCARFTYLDDGHASERVLSRVFGPQG